MASAVRSSARRGAAGISNADTATDETFVAGGKLYVAGCAGCHGELAKPFREDHDHFPPVPQCHSYAPNIRNQNSTGSCNMECECPGCPPMDISGLLVRAFSKWTALIKRLIISPLWCLARGKSALAAWGSKCNHAGISAELFLLFVWACVFSC
jgi:hypothetical protein